MIKSFFKMIDLIIKKIRDEHIAAFSAQAAFFIIISFFPFIMLLLSIIQYFPVQESTIMKLFTQIFPDAVNSLVIVVVNDIYDTTSSGTVISLTALTAMWSAGKGFLAIMKGLNSVYEIKETRNYILLRIVSALYTLIFAIMLIATMVLFVFEINSTFGYRQIPCSKGYGFINYKPTKHSRPYYPYIFFLIIYVVVLTEKPILCVSSQSNDLCCRLDGLFLRFFLLHR